MEVAKALNKREYKSENQKVNAIHVALIEAMMWAQPKLNSKP